MPIVKIDRSRSTLLGNKTRNKQPWSLFSAPLFQRRVMVEECVWLEGGAPLLPPTHTHTHLPWARGYTEHSNIIRFCRMFKSATFCIVGIQDPGWGYTPAPSYTMWSLGIFICFQKGGRKQGAETGGPGQALGFVCPWVYLSLAFVAPGFC